MVDKIILGSVQFGTKYGINNKTGKPSYDEVIKILDYAYLKGIRFIDSAEAYGSSHDIIGRYHRLQKNKFNVITKFSNSRSDLPKNITERVMYNLKTLDLSFLYCYMFHSFDDYVNYFKNFKSQLLELKNNNKIKNIGVSLYDNKDLEKVINDENINLIQIPFNLFDNSNQREKILKKAKKRGIEIHTRSVFLQGLFFKEINELNGKLNFFKKHLMNLRNLISKDQINDFALNYAFSKDYIDHVLVGVDNIIQLKNNLKVISKGHNNFSYTEVENIRIRNTSMLNPSTWQL